MAYFSEFYYPLNQSSKRKSSDDDEGDEFRNHLFKRTKRANEPTEFINYVDSPLTNEKIDLSVYWKTKEK